tara:strand:- start:168 stop:623 length:456 start_codon:yes stop_codon:yes gene_type:complete
MNEIVKGVIHAAVKMPKILSRREQNELEYEEKKRKQEEEEEKHLHYFEQYNQKSTEREIRSYKDYSNKQQKIIKQLKNENEQLKMKILLSEKKNERYLKIIYKLEKKYIDRKKSEKVYTTIDRYNLGNVRTNHLQKALARYNKRDEYLPPI